MKYLMWLLKAAIFFTLFAFALNNEQDATVHFFFGTQWRGPLVLMVPRWWKHRVAARRAQHGPAPQSANREDGSAVQHGL
jgi:lipopolysaccharide assembly protein A